MRITVFSCFSTVIGCTLILLLIRFLRHKKVLKRRAEAAVLTTAYLLCFIRMACPVDFTFSKGIFLRGSYAGLIAIFRSKIFNIGAWQITLYHICCIIIGLATVMKLWQFVRQWRKDEQLVYVLQAYCPVQVDRVNERLCDILPWFPKAAVKQSECMHIPYAAGICRKTVVLPEKEYTDDELYYILLHEYMHHLHHDIFFKVLIQAGACFFWWIPFRTFFCQDLEVLIELRCDARVRKSIGDQKLSEYLEVLAWNARTSGHGKYAYSPLSTVSLYMNKNKILRERFTVLTDTEKWALSDYAWMAGVFIIFACSYLVVLAPAYDPPQAEIEEDGASEMTPENTYLLYDGNTYAIVKTGGNPETTSIEYACLMIESGFDVKEVDSIAQD